MMNAFQRENEEVSQAVAHMPEKSRCQYSGFESVIEANVPVDRGAIHRGPAEWQRCGAVLTLELFLATLAVV